MVLPAGRLALGLQDARRKPLPGPGTVDASGRAEVLVGAAVVVEFARMDGGSMKVGARIASEPDIRRRMGTLMTEVQSIDRELDGLRDPSRLRALQSRRGDAVAENAMLSRATKAPFPRSGEWWLLIDSGGRRCAEFRVVLRKDGRR